jgi:hypothetical protein
MILSSKLQPNGLSLRVISLGVLCSATLLAGSPTAAGILDRYVKVAGGSDLWHAQKSERDDIEGRSLDDNRVVLRATIVTTRDGTSFSEVRVPQEATEGVYKGVAWAESRFSGVRIKHGSEREEAIRGARILEEADWRTLYPHALFAGTEVIDGKRFYKVQLSSTNAEWFDIDTGLLFRRVSSELSPEGPVTVGYNVESWTNRGGLKQPFSMLAFRGDLKYRLNMLSITWNEPAQVKYSQSVAEYLADPRPLPNAEEIIERHIFESGGIDAYANLKTQKVIGALTFLSSNTEAKVETFAAGGGKYFQSIDVPGLGREEEGSDGKVAWERSPTLGPRVKVRSSRLGLGVTTDAAQVIGWRYFIDQVRTEALERIDGRDCYRVRLIPLGKSQPQIRWYDKQTGLLYRSSAWMASDMGALPAVLTFEEYRDASGLKWPTKIRMAISGQNLLFTAADVKLNEPVESAVFDLPSEIDEMANKKPVSGTL